MGAGRLLGGVVGCWGGYRVGMLFAGEGAGLQCMQIASKKKDKLGVREPGGYRGVVGLLGGCGSQM
jgi:hypothetical protein